MEIVNNIHWLGQAAIKIAASGNIIYIDPYKIEETDEADIILITHPHNDHCSREDVNKVTSARTHLIAPADCLSKLEKTEAAQKTSLLPGEKTETGGITITAVPAYNIHKTSLHPKANKWVGYLIIIDSVTIYHAGDTERIPEMKNIECDIALLPLGQTYTMDKVEDAALAAQDVKARIAIPIHYGMYEGTKEDAARFQQLLEGKVKVIIKELE